MRAVQPVCSALATTNASAAATNTINVGGASYHTLYIDWTPGVSGNILKLLIQGRINGATDSSWFQETEWNESPTGTFTPVLRQLNVTATGTTIVSYQYVFQFHAEQIRVMVLETDDGGATKGTISMYLSSSTE